MNKDFHLPLRMLPYQSWGQKWSKLVSNRVEEILREEITKAEGGHLPPLEDVALHAMCLIGQDHVARYTWKGKPVLNVYPAISIGRVMSIRMETPMPPSPASPEPS